MRFSNLQRIAEIVLDQRQLCLTEVGAVFVISISIAVAKNYVQFHLRYTPMKLLLLCDYHSSSISKS